MIHFFQLWKNMERKRARDRQRKRVSVSERENKKNLRAAHFGTQMGTHLRII